MHNAQRRRKYAAEQQIDRSRDGRRKLYQPEPAELDPLVDYTQQGSRPGWHRETVHTNYAPRPARRHDDTEMVDYTRGGCGPKSIYEQPERGPVPAHVRGPGGGFDFTGHQRQQLARDDDEPLALNWADLEDTAQAYAQKAGSVVSFHRRPSDSTPRYDHLGRPSARPRGSRFGR